MKLLRIAAVLERTGLGRRTLYSEISAGRFPRPIQLTARNVGWLETDVDRWIQERVQAARDQEAA